MCDCKECPLIEEFVKQDYKKLRERYTFANLKGVLLYVYKGSSIDTEWRVFSQGHFNKAVKKYLGYEGGSQRAQLLVSYMAETIDDPLFLVPNSVKFIRY